MVRYLPTGFWLSIIIFVALQWLAIPVLDHFAYRAADIIWGVLIIIGIIYPIYFISTIIYLRVVKKLNMEQLVVAGAFLLIPPFCYIPLFAS